MDIFINNVTFFRVMLDLDTLRENDAIHRILGKIEIETIIKKINGRTLSQVEINYLSRSIRPKLIGSALLAQQEILQKIQRPNKIKRELIISNLNFYGYEIISLHPIPGDKQIPLEHLIGIIIGQFSEARFIESIPILLIKNKVDPYLLLEISIKNGIKNQIGYLLDISFIIAEHCRLSKKIYYLRGLLEYYRKNKNKGRQILGYGDGFEYETFLEKTSSKRIKRWNLLGRYFDKDFIAIGERYLR